jgi:flagellar assembly factor FliW
MRIETTRFGTIDVNDQSILQMPDGMLGFEYCTRFVLIEDIPESAFKWLQAVDDAAVAFIVINPADFFPEYEVELTDGQAESLDLKDPGESVMFTTVTVARDEGKVTTNLVAPIVINSRTLQARQVVLQDERYCTKHVIGYSASGSSRPEAAKAA